MYYKTFDFGEVTVHFAETATGHKKTTAGMIVTPKGTKADPKELCCGAMVQAAFAGDEPYSGRAGGAYASCRVFRPLKITRQVTFVNGDLNTYLSDGDGNEFVHRLKYERSTNVFSVTVRYENHSAQPRMLDFLSSFSLGGFKLLGKRERISLCRVLGAERAFGLEKKTFSQLGLSREGASFVWGGVGASPSRNYFPFAALESETGYVLGVQIEAPFSWRCELFSAGGDLVFSGGVSDYETGHFRKKILPGESFETPRVSFTLQTSYPAAFGALVKDLERRLPSPKCEEDLPVLYMDGTAKKSSSSPARVNRLLKTLKELSVGVYLFGSAARKSFSGGFQTAVGKMGEAGLRAGIVYDGEADFPDAGEDEFLKRDGMVLSVRGKRFPDLRRERYKNMLLDAVAEVKKSGFEYVGCACGADFGLGCDSPDGAAPGEGGRRAAMDGVRYLEQFTKCAVVVLISPLGEKIEPFRAGKIDLFALSFERDLPLAAANLSRVLPASRILIPAVLDKDEPDEKTEYSLCTAMLGRICLMGDLHLFAPEKLGLIQRGLEFYREILEIVKDGRTERIDCDAEDGAEETGRRIVIKDLAERRLIVVHFFCFEGALRISVAGYAVKKAFCSLPYGIKNGTLRIAGGNFRAGAFLLEKTDAEADGRNRS